MLIQSFLIKMDRASSCILSTKIMDPAHGLHNDDNGDDDDWMTDRHTNRQTDNCRRCDRCTVEQADANDDLDVDDCYYIISAFIVLT